uniref:F-box domain-containing protein n=1 Tax=Panagrolaimus sp. JU765 TaxID=591449 RepID=A0AC34PVS9_9BILA
MATNDYFPFMDLPQLVQELITDEIIQNLGFIDRGQFCLTSKYCNGLVQQSKTKKKVWISQIYENTIEIGESKILKFNNITKVAKFLKMVEIVQIEISGSIVYSEIGLSSLLEDLWLKAMKSVKDLILYIGARSTAIIKGIVRKLNNVNVYTVFFYEEDDEILPLIASKTNEKNPLKELQICVRPISKDDLKYLLKNCVFANSASIRLHYSQKCVKDVIEGIGKFEISIDKFNHTVYTIKTGVKIIKTPGDDNTEIKVYAN